MPRAQQWRLLAFLVSKNFSSHVHASPTPIPTPFSLLSPCWLLKLTIRVNPADLDLLHGGLHLLNTSGKCSEVLTWFP
jgi:hypothetical protein